MVIGAFPLAKLGALLIRQISKPLANSIISQAKNSPFFRNYICMPPAQFYNWCEVKTKMWILNLGRPVNIPVLNEQMAIELGANLLGEGIIFSIAAVILISEYNRSSRKEAAKEAAKTAEITTINNNLQEMFLQLEEQRTQIRELMRIVSGSDLPDRSALLKKNDSEKKDDPKDKPPFSPSGISINTPLAIQSNEPANVLNRNDDSTNKSTNLLLRAVEIIENDYFKNPNQKREMGILPLAINHLYQDVYKIPVIMY